MTRPTRPRTNRTEPKTGQILQLWKEKEKTHKEIAAEVGVSPQYVYRVVQQNGLSTPVPRAPLGSVKQAVAKFMQKVGPNRKMDKETMAAIAREIHEKTNKWPSLYSIGKEYYRAINPDRRPQPNRKRV